MKGTITPSKKTFREIGTHQGKVQVEPQIRTFLWDNPEVRRAFKEAKDKERKDWEVRQAECADRHGRIAHVLERRKKST
jgi:hypothetical protein